MTKNTQLNLGIRVGVVTLFAASLTFVGCGKKEGAQGEGESAGEKTVIQNIGSDTMVNLAQAWAEVYAKIDPTVSVEVSGGGSGIGVAALINGTCDIANSSRSLEPEEIQKAKAKHGQDPKEFLVGYDALAIYVHPSNPINEISVEELSEIYKEGGKIDNWSQLGVTLPTDKIIRVSRQNNSGTYHYFREMVVGKKSDMKLGSNDMNGSKDVVQFVERTPNAIGYSGLGYRTDKVKVLKVSKKKGDPAIEPSIESTWAKTYPIARPMFMYCPGTPPPHVQKYLAWIVTDDGQAVVKDTGYVPLPK